MRNIDKFLQDLQQSFELQEDYKKEKLYDSRGNIYYPKVVELNGKQIGILALYFDSFFPKDYIEMSRIKINKDLQNQGLGSEIMNTICSCADKYSITIRIFAIPDGVANSDKIERLRLWYSRFSFKKENKDGYAMERFPKII